MMDRVVKIFLKDLTALSLKYGLLLDSSNDTNMIYIRHKNLWNQECVFSWDSYKQRYSDLRNEIDEED